jgi:hypothetical protein
MLRAYLGFTQQQYPGCYTEPPLTVPNICKNSVPIFSEDYTPAGF